MKIVIVWDELIVINTNSDVSINNVHRDYLQLMPTQDH
jgi:hypothetical protein